MREVLKAPARWDTLYLVGNALTARLPAGDDQSATPKAFVGYDASGRAHRGRRSPPPSRGSRS